MTSSLASAVVTKAVALIPTPPPDVDPSTGKGPEWGKAAPIGLLVILLLCVAMYFLMRSMNRKIKAVPASFDPPAADARENAADLPGGSLPTDAAATSAGPEAEPGPPGLVDERSA